MLPVVAKTNPIFNALLYSFGNEFYRGGVWHFLTGQKIVDPIVKKSNWMQLFGQELHTVISSYHRFLITHGSGVVHVNEPFTVAVAEARDSLSNWSRHGGLMLDSCKSTKCVSGTLSIFKLLHLSYSRLYSTHTAPPSVFWPLTINTLCCCSSAVCFIYFKSALQPWITEPRVRLGGSTADQHAQTPSHGTAVSSRYWAD